MATNQTATHPKIDRCCVCNAMVDTEADPHCYDDVSVCVCKNCRAELTEQMRSLNVLNSAFDTLLG